VGEAWAVKVRFTKRAAAQISTALDYVAAQSPLRAGRIGDRLNALMVLLQDHPQAGRATSRPGVRRLAATPFQYLIDYRVTATEIIVMRFRHAARRPRG
jgi:plasmid stabilization system protein ParE